MRKVPIRPVRVADWMFKETPLPRKIFGGVNLLDVWLNPTTIARVTWVDGEPTENHSVFKIQEDGGIDPVTEEEHTRGTQELLFVESYTRPGSGSSYFPGSIWPGCVTQRAFKLALRWDDVVKGSPSEPEWLGEATGFTKTSLSRDGKTLTVEERYDDPEHPPVYHRKFIYTKDGLQTVGNV